jgi:hypothetical protein
MRCQEINEIVESGAEWTPALREHLKNCPACAAMARDAARLRAGLAVLRNEQPPEPSWGFAQRVMQRLTEVAEQGVGQEFFERAGRRVVFATLVVTLMALLSLVLPSSGPLRGPDHPTALFAQPESVVDSQEPMLGVGSDSMRVETINYSTSESGGDQPQK